MKIIIQHNDGEWPIDTDNAPERSLDELLDGFTPAEVRFIINQSLQTFRSMCEIWNQRELAQRRAIGMSEEA